MHKRELSRNSWQLLTHRPLLPGESPFPATVPFSDVLTTDFFFYGVRYYFVWNAIGGYSDNTFRPG